MNIRLASIEDLASIQNVMNEAYRPAGVPGWTDENTLLSGARIGAQQLIEVLQRTNTTMLVGELSPHGVVATILLEHAGDAVYLGMLAVSPERQARGMGKQLLAAAEAYASRHWQPRRFVMSVLSARSELINFYLRRGYVRTGKVLDFPHDANVGVPKVPGLTLDELAKILPSHDIIY